MVLARERKPAPSSTTTRRKEKEKVPAKKEKRCRSHEGSTSPRPRENNSPKRGKSPLGKKDRLPCYKYNAGRRDEGNKCDFLASSSLYILQAWPMYGRKPPYLFASGQREFGDQSTNPATVSPKPKNKANGSITIVVYVLSPGRVSGQIYRARRVLRWSKLPLRSGFVNEWVNRAELSKCPKSHARKVSR